MSAASAQAPGYRVRRTLPFRVEFVRQLRRWRTIVAFAVLVALPWILVAAFKISGPGSAGNGTPGLVTVATQGGLNFAAFSLFVSAGFLLVVVVALFCGDTVASEASWSSLRYLLAAPVPRARLLRQKRAVALAYDSMTRQMCHDIPGLTATLGELGQLCERYGFAYYREWVLILDGWSRGGGPGVVRARVGHRARLLTFSQKLLTTISLQSCTGSRTGRRTVAPPSRTCPR